MQDLIQIVATYGYLVLFFGVLAEQLGLPLPSNFILIIVGALAGSGQLELAIILPLALGACVTGNVAWFYIGRRRGYQVLGFLCRISLEPDRCINSSKGLFKRHGARSLLAAKFVPGFSIFAPPLAGATGMNLGRFLSFNCVGSLLWVSVFVGLGYVFSNQIETVIEYASSFGSWFVAVLVVALVAYFGWKYLARRRFIKSLRVARISPEALRELLRGGEDVMIVDLRESLDFEANPTLIATAVRMAPDEINERHEELPRDRDIILYCT